MNWTLATDTEGVDLQKSCETFLAQTERKIRTEERESERERGQSIGANEIFLIISAKS